MMKQISEYYCHGRAAVAIVGRPNVGKSFNRLAGMRLATVLDKPGVTRDRLYAACSFAGKHFSVIDTGGLDFSTHQDLLQHIKAQIDVALSEAEVIILVLDAKDGLTALDQDIVSYLRRRGKPVVAALNKVDIPRNAEGVSDFCSLGLPHLFPVSAEHGLGIGDLLEKVVGYLPLTAEEACQADQDRIRIAVLGRPNVGKSTFINSVLGEDRVLVGETPGTTRDAIDTQFELGDRKFTLIDTAGIRRKGRINEFLEKLCVIKALKSIERTHVALLLLDAREGPTAQDAHIAGYAHERGRAIIIVANKWDLVGSKVSRKQFERDLRLNFKFLEFAPVIFTSALQRVQVHAVLKMAARVFWQYSRRLPGPELQAILKEATAHHSVPRSGGRTVRLYSLKQVAIHPPTLVLTSNKPQTLHFSYLRYLQNRVRDHFGLFGTPVLILTRRKK